MPHPDHPGSFSDLADPGLYLNRELSRLEFTRRVLEEALDQSLPLLERVKFLAIVSTNLDAFFMVRVAGIKHQIAAGVIERSTDGLLPRDQLRAIHRTVVPLMERQRQCYAEDLLPALAAAGIDIRDYAELDHGQQAGLAAYFEAAIFPVLTPLAFDPSHPFPHISNLSLNLAVGLRDPDDDELFARLKVPATLPRLVAVPGGAPDRLCFTWLEQIIAANIAALFPGMQVSEVYPFRILRNADMALAEDEASDLLETIAQGVRQRRFGAVVKLSVHATMPQRIIDLLIDNLEADQDDVYQLDGVLDLGSLGGLAQLDRPDLKHAPWVPAVPAALSGGADIFASIQRRDILLHHPYDSFAPVVDFLEAAARDPHVLAIKQTLYRVGSNSPIIKALLMARERDKQVAVLVELKARFDEESNIEWARTLERAGVHVTYGLVGLKAHAKLALVVRKDRDGMRRYLHVGTGNYNPLTAQTYTDFSLFTCRPEFGADASDLFNYLTGYSRQTDFRTLLVAPLSLRRNVLALIESEIAHQQAGRGGHLIFKVNALVDPAIIQALYRAAQAGVAIDLIVRGTCAIRPGVPGLSETIRVKSIVGRLLEHSRVVYARNGGDDRLYIGSPDLTPGNFERRVELLVPITEPALLAYLRDSVLGTLWRDTAQARVLNPNGLYSCALPPPGEPPFDSQIAMAGLA
ncbi:MAG TPA: polyphosphate kinase 1 [Herpetosiphonaceae bacterium]|nr:polyphosphate kinase 1 [Herpetosiphonaceae bacterium]